MVVMSVALARIDSGNIPSPDLLESELLFERDLRGCRLFLLNRLIGRQRQLAGVCDDHIGNRFVTATSLNSFDSGHHVHAVDYFAEDDVFAVLFDTSQ